MRCDQFGQQSGFADQINDFLLRRFSKNKQSNKVIQSRQSTARLEYSNQFITFTSKRNRNTCTSIDLRWYGEPDDKCTL